MNGKSEDLEKRKKKFSIIQWIISVLVVIILGCCSYAAIRYYTADREMLGQNADQMVSIAGSINRFLKPVPDWHRISERAILTHEEFAGIDGSGETVPITAELARQYSDISDAQLWDYIGHHGTDKAYENLILGKENNLKWYEMPDQKEASHPVSLIFVTAPSAEEYEKADAEGVSLEAEPVALDGFVFITHKDNPVDSLSLQQIRDIYAGRITNWKEVGGNDERILAYQRTENTGIQTAMEELVMNGEEMIEAPYAIVQETRAGMEEKVAEYENKTAAIGYTYYYYFSKLYADENIKMIGIDGISPDKENMISGKYPFTDSYYVVIRSDEPDDSVYRELRDYLLTEEGQQIIEMAGYSPVR